jgi:hypothetical protein
MNGHHASCILRYSSCVEWRAVTDKDCARAAKFPFPPVAGPGYKTFQIPHVQLKKGWRIFLQDIWPTAYRNAGVSGSDEE